MSKAGLAEMAVAVVAMGILVATEGRKEVREVDWVVMGVTVARGAGVDAEGLAGWWVDLVVGVALEEHTEVEAMVVDQVEGMMVVVAAGKVVVMAAVMAAGVGW